MFRALTTNLQLCWKALVLADVLFKVIAFVLLTPLVSLLFRLFLTLSGRTILADADIAHFLMHPVGWIAVVAVGGAAVGILALEQSALMAISLASAHGQTLSVRGSLQFVAGKGAGMFRIAALLVGLLLAVAAPFLAASSGLYLLLLTDHDINYYLTEKPPRFWLAVLLIGVLLVVMTAILLRWMVNWSVAMQLHLFENVPPRVCLRSSRERVHGSRTVITKWVVSWLTANALISWAGTAIVVVLGRWIVPASAGALWTLVPALGLILLLWSLVNFGSSLLAVISFAVLQTHVYDRFGRSAAFVLPASAASGPAWSPTWTRGRVVAALVVVAAGAALLGATAIHGVQLDDHVEITAHRGGAGKAPENTMAAILQGIEDQTDWVEIDVQESRDGVVIVAHDSDLKKVSGFDAKIWEATADELRAVDIGSYFDRAFSGERVPTLAEVLHACRGRVRVNIELKYYGHDQNLEQKVVDLVEEHEMADDIVVMSLNPDGVRKVKALRPDWTVGLLTAVAAGDLTRADADFLAVNTKLATHEFVRRAHEKGKAVYIWTLNDPVTMSMMISRGADNLITDHPAMARQVLDERAALSPVERLLIELAFLFGVAPAESTEQ